MFIRNFSKATANRRGFNFAKKVLKLNVVKVGIKRNKISNYFVKREVLISYRNFIYP